MGGSNNDIPSAGGQNAQACMCICKPGCDTGEYCVQKGCSCSCKKIPTPPNEPLPAPESKPVCETQK